jgi:phage tail-like protein
MKGDRGLALLADADQWARCSHSDTALLPGGGVELAWQPQPASAAAAGPAAGPQAGLAFDRWCRAYRSRPEAGRIQALPGSPAANAPGALRAPRGLAVDDSGRLYVAESGRGVVHVVDLDAQRLLRRVSVRGLGRPRCQPVDVAAVGAAVLVLARSPAVLLRVEGRRGPRPGPLVRRPRGAGPAPVRVAAGSGRVLLLWAGQSGGPAMVAGPDGAVAVTVPVAGDLELLPDGTLVVAADAGEDLRRFIPGGTGWTEIEPLAAPGYDGGAVAVAPDGRLAVTTADGYGWAAGARASYPARGRVLGYRLDAGAYRTRWGRIFMDACLPPGTAVRVHTLTSDDDEVPEPSAWTPARGTGTIRDPGLTPPLPPAAALAQLWAQVDADQAAGRVFRRLAGPEQAWAPPDPDGLQTYETPVAAPPGRYLWLLLELTGSGQATPRVRELRVERPGHRLAAALPRSWSAQEPDASFLQRFLAPAEGMLHELDEGAALRAVLLDPAAGPEESLPWLASLLGIVLDARWPEPARRSLLGQAYDLFRIRGTPACLERILRLYLPVPVAVVENWRLRGLAGAVLGDPTDGPAPPAVGGSGATGALGRFTVGGVRPGEDGYTVTAHRFTVLVCGALDNEQRDVVSGLLEVHKPAHTLAEICELGPGMRVGRHLHVGLSSAVGPGSSWAETVVGQVLVGADGVLGLPAMGSRAGSAAAGRVRVG